MNAAILALSDTSFFVIVSLLKCLVIFGVLLSIAAAMSLAERKVSAWLQYRHGPNRVGPFGLFQPVADLIKFVFKEELVPTGANRLIFRIAPLFALIPALTTFAFVPWGYTFELQGRTVDMVVAPISNGVLFLLAIGSLGVYGVIMAGWSSNSKYSLLGGLRSTAQMISYEISLFLSVLTVLVMAGSLDLREIVLSQDTMWFAFLNPVAFLVFLVTMFAETNRHPFDFAECEPEIVGGFHTEYSSMRFALFFMGEYCAMATMSAMAATLFLGGPDVPFLAAADTPWWAGLLAFATKTGFFLFLYLWVRWSLPRFRYDQLMRLGWKVFLPISLVSLSLTGLVVALVGE